MDSIEESYVEGDELNYGEYESEVGDVSKGTTSFIFSGIQILNFCINIGCLVLRQIFIFIFIPKTLRP